MEDFNNILKSTTRRRMDMRRLFVNVKNQTFLTGTQINPCWGALATTLVI